MTAAWKRDYEKLLAQVNHERVIKSATEMRLRYLCLTMIPDLRASVLLPGEKPSHRLDYLLSQVNEQTARKVVYG